MRALEVWVEKGSTFHSDQGNDVVPSELVLACFGERIKDDSSDVLPSLASVFSRIAAEVNGSDDQQAKRARAALRLVLSIGVHCASVNTEELEQINGILLSNQKLFSSEIRYLEYGGLASHAGAFPLNKRPDETSLLLKANWRKVCPGLKKAVSPSNSSKVLTVDVITRIMHFCDPRSLLRAASVSKEWHAAEASASEILWRHLLIAQWPDMSKESISEPKVRYRKRLCAMRSRKMPLGRRNIPAVVFCPVCDRMFSTSFHLSQHTCKTGEVGSKKKQSAKKRLKEL